MFHVELYRWVHMRNNKINAPAMFFLGKIPNFNIHSDIHFISNDLVEPLGGKRKKAALSIKNNSVDKFLASLSR